MDVTIGTHKQNSEDKAKNRISETERESKLKEDFRKYKIKHLHLELSVTNLLDHIINKVYTKET